MMLVLLADDVSLDELSTERLAQLSRLGVTDVSVLRDDSMIALVINGWAFEPARSGDEATAVITGHHACRALFPVMHAAVTPGS